MVIKIAQPKYLNERGNRHNNEDSIFPLQPTEDDTLFIVCDGVGGAALGEMASQRVAATIYHYMNRYFKGFTSVAETNQLIQGAVAAAELMLSQYIMKNPTAQGMATTLTLLHLHEGGATLAHVGDSRIYHFRQNTPSFVTEDHSYVNEMVKDGLITQEQALHHTHKNLITRAIQGGLEHPVQADVRVITNIQAGDYFLLCTDGITESWEDDLLAELLLSPYTDDNKIRAIQSTCDRESTDNFSCMLIPISEVTGATISENHFPTLTEISETSIEQIDMPLPKAAIIPIMPILPLTTPDVKASIDEKALRKKRFRTLLLWLSSVAIVSGTIFTGIYLGRMKKKAASAPIAKPAAEAVSLSAAQKLLIAPPANISHNQTLDEKKKTPENKPKVKQTQKKATPTTGKEGNHADTTSAKAKKPEAHLIQKVVDTVKTKAEAATKAETKTETKTETKAKLTIKAQLNLGELEQNNDNPKK